MDFVADQLWDGRRLRCLTVVDIFTRESLAIEVGQTLKGGDVVRVLNRLKQERGAPKVVFCNNGAEFTGQTGGPVGLQERSEERLLASG